MLRIVIYVTSCIAFIQIGVVYSQDICVAKDGSIRTHDARAMVFEKGSAYLATKEAVYASTNSIDSWRQMFSISSGSNEINCLSAGSSAILVGTNRGLYRSQDKGLRWEKAFRAIIPGRDSVLCIASYDSDMRSVYIGTKNGVFLSNDGGNHWQALGSTLRDMAVWSIALVGEDVYASTDSGIFVKRPENIAWERIVVNAIEEKEAYEGSAEDGSEEDLAQPIPYCVYGAGSCLYIGKGKKLTCTNDGGKKWQAISSSGLRGSINCMLVSGKNGYLYASTTKGVYAYNRASGYWRELYLGTDRSLCARSIVFGDDEERLLWAVTEKGSYKFELIEGLEETEDLRRGSSVTKIEIDGEPPFKELRMAALKYAEVGPEKIAKWRRDARLKALVPKVSVSGSTNRSTNTEIYTSATKDYAVVGPDDTSDGWDLSLSWELSDIIWGDDQTNIDVRSRLTTQLRNDILDDLRRAYFERKRVQHELINGQIKDQKVRYDKVLRLDELTQAIDDLTGNYLTEHSKNIHSK